MGIENTLRSRLESTTSGLLLITPHGDRKPLSTKPSEPASWRCSLPLMGIENSTARTCSHARLLRAHYPSWGSKTAARRASDSGDARGLITPHGDRKRDRRSPRAASHYPSWGSKTPRMTLALADSLPLMGIENSSPFCRQRPRTRLITPHGDRKRFACYGRPATLRAHYPSGGSRRLWRRSSRPPELITPHGDRKLARLRRRLGA